MGASIVGTASYIHPDIIKTDGKWVGHEDYNAKEVDWWTVGIVCYEMVVGVPAFGIRSKKFTRAESNSFYKRVLDRKLVHEKGGKQGNDIIRKRWDNVSPDCQNFIHSILKKQSGEPTKGDDLLKHKWFEDFRK